VLGYFDVQRAWGTTMAMPWRSVTYYLAGGLCVLGIGVGELLGDVPGSLELVECALGVSRLPASEVEVAEVTERERVQSCCLGVVRVLVPRAFRASSERAKQAFRAVELAGGHLGLSNDASGIQWPATLKKAENEAIVDAIAAFKARATVIADALGKAYRIKQLSINSSGRPMEMSMLKVRGMLAAEATPMPIEAGESQISANISGQIELLD
jgi:hypothetical protein